MLKYVPTFAIVLIAGFTAWYTDSLFWGFMASTPFLIGVEAARWMRREEAAEVTSVPDIIPTYLQRQEREEALYREALTSLKADPIIDEDGEVLPPVPGDVVERYKGPRYFKGE